MALIALALALLVHALGHRLAARALKLDVDLSLHSCCAPNDPARFGQASLARRLMLAASGSLASYLGAMVPLTLLLALTTAVVPTLNLAMVAPGSPAEEAGLREGDELISADGAPLKDFEQLRALVAAGPERLGLEVRRGPELLRVELAPRAGPTGAPVIGIAPRTAPQKLTFAEAISRAHRMPLELLERLLVPPARLTTVGGPVAIYRSAPAHAKEAGLTREVALSFAAGLALYSLSFGLLHLLPIPGLDGWLLVLGLRELATRRKPDYLAHLAARGRAVWVFGVAVVLIFALVIKNDFARLGR